MNRGDLIRDPPGRVVIGEYESVDQRLVEELLQFKQMPGICLRDVRCHFDLKGKISVFQLNQQIHFPFYWPFGSERPERYRNRRNDNIDVSLWPGPGN